MLRKKALLKLLKKGFWPAWELLVAEGDVFKGQDHICLGVFSKACGPALDGNMSDLLPVCPVLSYVPFKTFMINVNWILSSIPGLSS